jgi:hypothetical protein
MGVCAGVVRGGRRGAEVPVAATEIFLDTGQRSAGFLSAMRRRCRGLSSQRQGEMTMAAAASVTRASVRPAIVELYPLQTICRNQLS